ncbi:MAG: glycosyltransferase family 39 protein [Candidatus Moranbacteria bacterium]|nr:glycosyltransferase family 39 protein [Candidatus Moranbacteria bacterium]
MKKNRYTIIFLTIISFYSIFSFSVMKDFGITYDEPTQQTIGHVMSDYVDGTSKSFDALKDDVIYYGPFFETLNYKFGNAMEKSFRVDQVDAFYILITLAFILGIFFLFKLVSEMFDKRTALVASAFLMLQPVVFAHSHYNSKDIPITALFIIALYFLYSGFTQKKLWKIILGGIVTGFLADTRIDGVMLLPVFFGAYILFLISKLKNIPRQGWLNQLKKDIQFTVVFLIAMSATVYAA